MKINLNSAQSSDLIKAYQALMQVIDPELQVNIIDLGLIYDVDFTLPQQILVKMTLSTPSCPLSDAIQNGVTHVLQNAFPGQEISIQLVWEPSWNYNMISDAGKEQLGLL